MPLSVLICGRGPLADQVHETPLGRADLQRHRADSAAAALVAAPKVSPRLVLIDRDLGGAADLVQKLRKTPPTVHASIVIVAEGDFSPSELDLLELGANAVLRFPPGPDWEERLARLLEVPVRKQVRVNASFALAGQFGEQRIEGRIVNLSRTGMLIETAAATTVGDQFTFKLEIGNDDEVEGTARIVRLAGNNRYGCEFASMDAWAARKVDIFVQQT